MTVTAASESAPAGLQNDGYWGIAVRPNTTYTGSFYAKADTGRRADHRKPGKRRDRRIGGQRYGERA